MGGAKRQAVEGVLALVAGEFEACVVERQAELPQAHSWEEGPPEDKALLSLEFELRHSLPNRAYAMKRLHALSPVLKT